MNADAFKDSMDCASLGIININMPQSYILDKECINDDAVSPSLQDPNVSSVVLNIPSMNTDASKNSMDCAPLGIIIIKITQYSDLNLENINDNTASPSLMDSEASSISLMLYTILES